jgi:hypothetical protein
MRVVWRFMSVSSEAKAVDLYKGLDCGRFDPEKSDHIPRNHRMMFDIVRDDSAYAGAAQINYPLTFGGMKVFPA